MLRGLPGIHFSARSVSCADSLTANITAFSSARLRHRSGASTSRCDWVLVEQPHRLHCPFPTAHEDESFLRPFWRSRRLVEPSPQAHLCGNLPAEVHFFTDGSCRRPEMPAARHAAWAVIMYAGCDPPDLEADISFWKLHALPPPYWHVVAQGCVPGRQDINRAECCAWLQALQVAASLEVRAPVLWSDSANAIRAVSAACNGAAMPRDVVLH